MDDETRARIRAVSRRVDRVNDWLHVGGALPPEEYEKIVEAGVTHVVDLRQDNEEHRAWLRDVEARLRKTRPGAG